MAKINSEYDVAAAFEAIENEIIASMIRNMERHKLEEIDEKKQWSMWQAEELHSLEEFKKRNKKRFQKEFKDINAQIEGLIWAAKDEGEMQQEIKILEAIKKGFSPKKPKGGSGEFFRLNERKLEALIKATMNDIEKAEISILRRAEDKYRKIIFNAQMYANTGAGTYESAIDMAVKDYTAAGIDCVEYANGSKHSLEDYADMAIRTACKRAYLTGEGNKRAEWGIPTVIVNKRGNPCPKCLPFCGKVLVDDVWSNGPKTGISPVTGNKYKLMSEAVEAGLYHPRCRDSHTTYFEGVSTPPDGKFSREEINDIAEAYKKGQRMKYIESMIKKYKRLKDNALDGSNKRQYQEKIKEWEAKKDEYK